MSLVIGFAALFIIALLAYAVIAVRNIWSEQDAATAAFYEEVLPALKDTHSKMKAANDQTEKGLREYFAEKGIPYPETS